MDSRILHAVFKQVDLRIRNLLMQYHLGSGGGLHLQGGLSKLLPLFLGGTPSVIVPGVMSSSAGVGPYGAYADHVHGWTGIRLYELDGSPDLYAHTLLVSNTSLYYVAPGVAQLVTGGGTGGVGTTSYPQNATVWADEFTTQAGNALARYVDSTQSFGSRMTQESDANGDAWEWVFYLKAGTYTFSVLGVISNYAGKIDWTVDGSSILSAQDWYNATIVWNTVKTASVTIATDGVHILRATVNGKNGSSSGYYAFLTKMWFR